MSIAPKPEWDTPPHGDFAAYVERLSGAVPGAQSAGRLLQASSPATRPNPKAGPGKRTEAVVAVQGKAVAPGPYSVWEPLSRVVRAVRGVLLLSVVVQVLMLFVLEPFVLHKLFQTHARRDPLGPMARIQRVHVVLLTVSLIVVVGAVAGSHGGWVF